MTTDDMDFEKSMKDTLANVDENTTVKAIVLDINEKEGVVFLDVNLKSEAQVPLTDFETKPSIGDEVDVYLIYKESHDGVPVVSLTKARQMKEKENLTDKINSNELVEGEVVEVRKYGVLVKYGTLYGLIPLAFWDRKRIDDVSTIKEKKVSFYIEKLAQKKDGAGKKGSAKEIKEDFIANRRRALFESVKKSKSEFFDKVNVDDVLNGVVKNITDFGAFVEVAPGIEGLLHITNISWNKVSKVEDVLKKGDEVKVKILSLNKEKNQVSLGLKQLEKMPWDTFIEKYKVDDVVKGSVSSVTTYGAFIKIIDGVEALLHISDMSWTKNVKHPKELLSKGQVVEVKIIAIDPENKKINVSLKHLLENPWESVETKYAEGTKVKGKVKSVTDFGAFIELEEGVDALLHKDEISWTENNIDPKEYFAINSEIEVEVILLDVNAGKIKVSLKRLQDDPWKNIPDSAKVGDIIECPVKEINMEKGVVVEPYAGFTTIIPFSHIAMGRVDEIKSSINDRVKVGETVKAIIKEIDMRRRVFFLSIRDLEKVVTAKKVREFESDATDSKFTLGDMFNQKKND
jgi:small subunit ribosomal protein S1